jgi:hypothetical protein
MDFADGNRLVSVGVCELHVSSCRALPARGLDVDPQLGLDVREPFGADLEAAPSRWKTSSSTVSSMASQTTRLWTRGNRLLIRISRECASNPVIFRAG